MRRARNQRGESLIESMVALAVFAIAMLGILEMNLYARGQLSMAGSETKAAELGRDLIDAFDRLPYDSPVFAEGTQYLSNAAFRNDTTGRPLLGAADAIAHLDLPPATSVRWSCTRDVDADGEEQGTAIRIFVTFPIAGGQTKTLELDTYKYDLQAVTGSTNPTEAI